MALFHDLDDKKLVLAKTQVYRCLYLDKAEARLLVFDKTVLKGDIGSLIQLVKKQDAQAGAELEREKARLRTCDLASNRTGYDLTFAAEIDTDTVVTRLKQVNTTLASKFSVKVAPPEEKGRGRSLSMGDLPRDDAPEGGRERSQSDVGVVAPVAAQALERLERAFQVWIDTYGDPPGPPADDTSAQQLATVRQTAEAWLDKHGKNVTDDEKKRGTRVLESSKVLAARLELAGKQGVYRPVDITPILAWKWCDKHVEKGALKDILKATLPPYEKAVQAFQRAPSEKTRAGIVTARTQLERGLKGAVEHYTKKGGDETKKKLAEALLEQAKRQAGVVAGLAEKLGELDPETCEREGARKLTEAVETRATTAREEYEETARKAREGAERAIRALDQRLVDIETEYQDKLRQIDQDDSLDGTAKEEARTKARSTRDTYLEQNTNMKPQRTQKFLENMERQLAEANAKLGLAVFTWAWCKDNLPKKGPLYKALDGKLADFEKARAKLAEGATPAAHAAAWKALQAVEKALGGAKDAYLKALGKEKKDTDGYRAVEAEYKRAKAFLERLDEEKSNLEAVEAELPQGKLAKALAGTDDGRATLDAWVEDLGGQAKTDDDKAMVRAAMRERFQIKRLDGDMTTKALPKLYKILGMVPEAQTRDNPVLNRVHRDRAPLVPSGFYNYDKKKDDGVISMNMPRTGKSGVMKKLFGAILPYVEKPEGGWEGSDVKKSERKIIFSHLTLHEVGHSVDEQLGFMDAHLGDTKYGDWRASSAEEVRDVAGDKLGFYAALDGVKLARGAEEPGEGEKTIGNDPATRKAFLSKYLDLLLEKKDPTKDETLKAQAEKYAVDWKALDGHAGVKFVQAARLNPGAIREVTQWDAKAKSALVDGRVYQEAYEDTWWSYDVNARKRGIGGYQFRAPGEWFSEIYACYYGGRLKSSHPDYAWLKALVAKE